MTSVPAPVLQYEFNSTSTLTTDSVGTFDSTVNNGTSQVTDVGATEGYGNTAHFDNSTDFVMSTVPTTLTNNSARTISTWIYSNVDSVSQVILGTATGTGVHIFQKTSGNKISIQNDVSDVESTSSVPLNTWSYVTATYDGSNSVKIYVNGVHEATGAFAWNVGTQDMKYIGSNNSTFFSGNMLDLRVYDLELTAAQVLEVFTDGPTTVNPLSITIGSIYATASWIPVTSTYYRLTSTDSVGGITVILDNSQESSATIDNLEPLGVYTIDLYSSTDTVTYTLFSSSSITALANTDLNFDKSLYLNTDSVYDMTNLSTSTWDTLSDVINEIFTTSDVLKVLSATGEIYETTFLNRGDSVTISDSSAMFLPFDDSLLAGQECSIVQKDGTISSVAFDHTSNSVTIESVVYGVGDSFIFDGKRMFVEES